MSASNGVIRIGRKGLKKFAFGDGPVFEVDVVVAFQQWVAIDESFRPETEDADGNRRVAVENMAAYHQAAVEFVSQLQNFHDPKHLPMREMITTAEALDFIARLREQYEELAVFFRPNLQKEQDLPASSGAELRFSEEAS